MWHFIFVIYLQLWSYTFYVCVETCILVRHLLSRERFEWGEWVLVVESRKGHAGLKEREIVGKSTQKAWWLSGGQVPTLEPEWTTNTKTLKIWKLDQWASWKDKLEARAHAMGWLLEAQRISVALPLWDSHRLLCVLDWHESVAALGTHWVLSLEL